MPAADPSPQHPTSAGTTTSALLHDLRGPLHAVIGRLDLAAQGLDSTDVDTARHLTAARTAATHMAELISGHDGTEPANLTMIIADTVNIVEALHPDVVITEVGEPSDIILSDHLAAVRILVNLMTNSARHGSRTLTITHVIDPPAIDINDAGPGAHTADIGDGLTLTLSIAADLGLTACPSPARGWRLMLP